MVRESDINRESVLIGLRISLIAIAVIVANWLLNIASGLDTNCACLPLSIDICIKCEVQELTKIIEYPDNPKFSIKPHFEKASRYNQLYHLVNYI